MSAHPPQSTPLSRTIADEPASADAASTPAAGSKRRASDNAAPNAAAAASSMDAPPSSNRSSMDVAADAQSAAPALAAASSAAPSPASASDAATRKKQRLDQSISASPAGVAPPWSRLYSDALHSIFKFASLADLTRLMSVNRRWGEAVMTTPPIAASATISSAAHLRALLDSPLRRHVSKLLRREALGAPLEPYPIRSLARLQSVSTQAPWLTELCATPPLSYVYGVQAVCSAITRFRQLRCLELDCLSGSSVKNPSYAEACVRIMETVSRLNPATMLTFKLVLPKRVDRISFAPLSALTQLRVFEFDFEDGQSPLTDDQIQDLRAMTSLHQLISPPYCEEDETEFLVRMLQPGHALQWTTLGSDGSWVEVTAPLAALLGSLPTLTSLRVWMYCGDVQFFAQLTQLTDLELDGHQSGVDPAEMVSSLLHCTQLTRLKLVNVDCTSRHMEQLLPCFPLLSSLELHQLPQLDSLRCFATPALAVSLKSLVLGQLRRCPPSELPHLLGLRSLQSVSIMNLARPLTREDKAAFRVPSSHFPALDLHLQLQRSIL